MATPSVVFRELYRHGFVETVFNARDPLRRDGWTLKNGSWSPLYINLRPLGAEPGLAWEVAEALARMLADKVPECDGIVGIDMAGVPLAALVSAAASQLRGRPLPFLYTRPLPGRGKVRSPEEAREVLGAMRSGPVSGWGGHRLVEGRLEDGARLVLIDDVSTSFGSKAIAREWVRFAAEASGVQVTCESAAIIVDREQGAQEQAAAEGMRLFSLIGLKSEGLALLAGLMPPAQHAFLARYLDDPASLQDDAVRAAALAEARGA